MPGLTNPQLQVKSDHRYLGCLHFELDLPYLKVDPLLPPQPTLRLQITFNPRWQDLGSGKVCLGLRRGTLRLELQGGHIAPTDRLLPEDLDLIASETHSEHRLVLEHRAPVRCYPLSIPDHPEALIWGFEPKQDQILTGVLPWSEWVTVTRTEPELLIQAWFEAREEDLWVMESEHLWPPSLSANKLTVSRRLLARRIYRGLDHPYLSYVELRYG